MDVSVVIASSRSNDLVKACVESLKNQTVLPLEIILVVDSEDQEEDFKQFFQKNNLVAKVYSSGDNGTTPARNKGIQESRGDIIAFIDDDAIATNTWIEEINRTFKSVPGTLIVGGPVIPMFRGKSISEKWYWMIGCTSTVPLTTRPISCNMAVTRKCLEEIGGFLEVGRRRMKLHASEETELCERVAKKYPSSITWNDRVLVRHDVPPSRITIPYMVHRAYIEGVGKAVMSIDHPLWLEKSFLGYHLTHPDRYTVPVLLATGTAFIIGRLKRG